MENSEFNKSELVLTKESLGYLDETRKWAMFFAILGFISIGFILIVAIVLGVIGLIGGSFGGFNEGWIFGIVAVVYLALGVLYFFPILYLLKFSTNMKTAINQSEQNKISLAFYNLKSHFRFVGILTIVLFGVYILGIIVFMLVGLSSVF